MVHRLELQAWAFYSGPGKQPIRMACHDSDKLDTQLFRVGTALNLCQADCQPPDLDGHVVQLRLQEVSVVVLPMLEIPSLQDLLETALHVVAWFCDVVMGTEVAHSIMGHHAGRGGYDCDAGYSNWEHG